MYCFIFSMLLSAGALAEEVGSRFKTFGPYILSTARIKKLEILIETDIATVSRNLEKIDSSDYQLVNYLRPATGDVSFKTESNRLLLNSLSDTNYGHVTPYVLSATLFFLERFYASDAILPTTPDDDLLQIPTLDSQRLTVVVVSDPLDLTRRLQDVGAPNNAQAYYDPRTKTLLISFEPSLLRHFAFQEKWSGHSHGYFITELRDHFFNLFLYQFSHELFHFIQENSTSPYYQLISMREGSAVSAAVDVTERFRLRKLAHIEQLRGLHPATSCVEPPSARLFTIDEVPYYQRVEAFLDSNPEFSVTDWALKYTSTLQNFDADVELNYGLSLVLYKFLLSIDKSTYREWRANYDRFLNSKIDKNYYNHFDAYFVTKTLEQIRYLKKDMNISLENAYNRSDECLQTSPLRAYIWLVIANNIAPELPQNFLYIGDVFSDAGGLGILDSSVTGNNTLISLYFYRTAYVSARELYQLNDREFCAEVPNERYAAQQILDMLRIYARLGEVYAAAGAVDLADKYFECSIRYSNNLAFTENNYLGVYTLVTTLSSDLQRVASRRIVEDEFVFSRRVYDTMMKVNSEFKAVVLQAAHPLLESGQIEKYIEVVCVAYALNGVVLAGEFVGKQGRDHWDSDVRMCAWVKWSDGQLLLDESLKPRFKN